MIDRGLLLTIVVILGVVGGLDRWLRRPVADQERVLGIAATPVLIGLLAARFVAVALDDPGAVRRPFDLLLIRGGMDFWPGVAAALVGLWMAARRGSPRPLERSAELAPFALWAYAAYEMMCLVREGCFGPQSAVGLRPGGIGPTQVPVGVLVGLSAAGLGVAVWRGARWLGALRVILVSIAGLAALRSGAGFLLPRVTPGLTRPHRESLAVTVLALLWGLGLLVRHQSSHRIRRPQHSAASPRERQRPVESGPD